MIQLVLKGCRVDMERMVPFGGWISMAGYFGRRPCSVFREIDGDDRSLRILEAGLLSSA